MGTVLQIVKGLDKKVTILQIKQSNGAVEFHSICNLYPLELTVTHPGRDLGSNEGASQSNTGPTQNSGDSVRATRPKRKATERFQRMLRQNIDYL